MGTGEVQQPFFLPKQTWRRVSGIPQLGAGVSEHYLAAFESTSPTGNIVCKIVPLSVSEPSAEANQIRISTIAANNEKFRAGGFSTGLVGFIDKGALAVEVAKNPVHFPSFPAEDAAFGIAFQKIPGLWAYTQNSKLVPSYFKNWSKAKLNRVIRGLDQFEGLCRTHGLWVTSPQFGITPGGQLVPLHIDRYEEANNRELDLTVQRTQLKELWEQQKKTGPPSDGASDS